MKGRERTAKWYFRNEEEVLKELGLKPAKGSGSGWVQKEDGENDYIIAQLKSTDKQSYSLKQLDIEKLEYNAMVAGKIPVFILQFLNKDRRYAIVELDNLSKAAEYLETGKVKDIQKVPDLIDNKEKKKKRKPAKVIKNSVNAREQFYKEKDEYWEKKRWERK